MNKPEEHTVDYWLRKMQLWSVLHPNVHEKHMLCGSNKDCPHLNEDNSCKKKSTEIRVYATPDFTKAVMCSREKGMNMKTRLYCMEWIKYE